MKENTLNQDHAHVSEADQFLVDRDGLTINEKWVLLSYFLSTISPLEKGGDIYLLEDFVNQIQRLFSSKKFDTLLFDEINRLSALIHTIAEEHPATSCSQILELIHQTKNSAAGAKTLDHPAPEWAA